MRFKLLQNDVGRNLEEDVWHKEDGQCYIVLRGTRGDAQIFSKAENEGICDVRPANQFSISDAISKASEAFSQVLPVQEGEEV